MKPSLPPIPPRLAAPKVERLPIQPPDKARTTGRVGAVQLRLIGAVAVAWARLEHVINDLIWTVNDNDIATGRLDTQDLDITKLLSALGKARSTNLPGPSFSNERKSIADLIASSMKTKQIETWLYMDHGPREKEFPSSALCASKTMPAILLPSKFTTPTE